MLQSTRLQSMSSRRSVRLRVRFGGREDRLSGLPDSLLDHILSFLPTKDAVATSILSKRWKPIWRSQLNIYLDHTSFPHTFAFRQFFDSFITMRDNTLPILSFHLKTRCDLSRLNYCNNHHLYDFVYPAAITRGLENLIIDLCHLNTLPPSILVLCSKTLSVLKLKMIELNEEAFPTVFDLPSLKVLHLKYVTFSCFADLHKLLSGCPILQELAISYLSIPNMMLPLLQIKKKKPVLPPPPLGIAISNLVRANIISDDTSIIGLEWLHNVHHLRIKLFTKLPTIRGVFYNLTHLELIFNFYYESCALFKWRWLKKLLQNTPNLQTLIIHELFKIQNPERPCFPVRGREWEDPEIVPECLLSHLTTCSLTNYTLVNSELRFAKYIMQNARLLSTITIQSAKFLDANTKLQMLIELSSCPRISPTSKLLFI